MFFCVLIVSCMMSDRVSGQAFPAAGWHRGNVVNGQENSLQAIVGALTSASPNIEVDIIDFINEKGEKIGLLAHDCDMDRLTGSTGQFSTRHHVSALPKNSVNANLPPEPFITVVDLFELIKATKENGTTPLVSLDMKEEGDSGREFGQWIGTLIQKYGFQTHIFASSFFKSNIVGVEESCPECLTGGLVFNDHYALKHLDYQYTSLDLRSLSRITFWAGFWGKKEFPHDFVLIQDDIVFAEPNLPDYWRKTRHVKFVGVFVHKKKRPYTDGEWKKLAKVDWLELDPVQMEQYLDMSRLRRMEQAVNSAASCAMDHVFSSTVVYLSSAGEICVHLKNWDNYQEE